jgi:hypothetical protein
MRVIPLAAALLAVGAASASAAVLGAFTNSRLYAPQYNLLTGADMDTAREVLTAAGVTITLTDTVTPEFLDTVDIFCTSFVATAQPSSAEVQAMANWVQAGGVLIVTAHCA